MSENSSAAVASFPLIPIAVLITVGLAVANAAGWIHVELWVILLPIFIVVGWFLAMLLVFAVVFGGGLLVYLGVDKHKRKKRQQERSGIVTPTRYRGLK